ncbi:MAG: hypothetical protein HYR96_09690 [Deltaproteobacteria bacterium]|nr:hypothetical protein [Deltaproteobacteria bacterium]
MTKYTLLVLAVAFSLTQAAQAAFSVEDLQSAAKLGIEEFRKSQAEHFVHFIGYKAWLSGEESKLKIYVNHEGMAMDFSYVCHKHDGEIECHAQ